jgi:hypothetical protein
MKDSDYIQAVDNLPQMVAVFRIIKVPHAYEGSLYKGDIVYGDGDYFNLSMHDYRTANPLLVRKPVTGGIAAREADYFIYLEPMHLEFVEYDHL